MKKIVQKKKTTTKMIVEDISEAEHREHKTHFFKNEMVKILIWNRVVIDL